MREVGVRLDECGDHQDAAQEYARNVEHHHVEQSTPAKQGEDQITKSCYDECEIGFVHANCFFDSPAKVEGVTSKGIKKNLSNRLSCVRRGEKRGFASFFSMKSAISPMFCGNFQSGFN